MIERDPFFAPETLLVKIIGSGFAIAMGVCVLTHTQVFHWTVFQELAGGLIGAATSALVR